MLERRPHPDRLARLATLAEQVQRVERGDASSRTSEEIVATGWPEVDASLVGGLMRGKIHEWFGGAPPLCIFAHLAWQALLAPDDQTKGDRGKVDRAEGDRAEADRAVAAAGPARSAAPAGPRGFVVWIGRRVWPYPRILLRGGSHEETPDDRRDDTTGLLLRRSLFIDPLDDAGRLWAIDLALRCPAVVAVVADGRGLGMVETRRLQLAAEYGGGTEGFSGGERGAGGGREGRAGLALLARPLLEVRELSAAATRWRVGPARSSSGQPRWEVELLRAKGVPQERHEAPERLLAPGGLRWVASSKRIAGRARTRRWTLEWDHAKGAIAPLAAVVDRPGAAKATLRGRVSERTA